MRTIDLRSDTVTLPTPEMRRAIAEIQDGRFAREWVTEDDNGRPNYTKLRAEGEQHPIEQVGARLRPLMSWLDNEE